MSEQGAVPMIIVTHSQDHVQAVNSTLRNAGHPVHCTWIPDIRDLGDALTQINPEMLLVFAEKFDTSLEAVMQIRHQFGPEVPALIVRDSVSEDVMAEAMRIGAQDVVSLGNRGRLQAVVTRELRAFRLERALNTTLSSAREYKQQLQAFMTGSADAIAHAAEGIIVDANPAWTELFGYSEADALTGQPLMDLFDDDTHSAVKGALVACMQGKWAGHPLRVNALLSDGSAAPLELQLNRTEFDGDTCVRICIATRRDTGGAQIEQQLKDAVRRDPSTGLLHRRFFVEALTARLRAPVKGGVRELAYVKPDKFASIQGEIGLLASEDFLVAFAELLRDQLTPNDLAGRFGGNTFVVLLERGTPRDVEAWADHVVQRVGRHVFQIAQKSFSATCTVGLAVIPAGTTDVSVALADANAANKRGRDEGGNQVTLVDRTESDTRVLAADKIWVKQIKAALMENRFRLVQQPIASLQGEDKGMFDVLVRMLDEQGTEVLPTEFMAAAERNDLMKNIDRWVIGASMSFGAARKPSCIFVRLSRDSVVDKSLISWLQTQLKAIRIEPQRICFQVTEEVATQHLNQIKDLVKALRTLNFRFALEHFGAGRDPHALLGNVASDFIKIDGSLMQGLATNNQLQQTVKGLVEAAKKKKVETIAERVEDANTMAVLWQLGIEFIQGYFVNAPEEVVIGTR
ncbi:MAG TPA: EAL domain-containing protein [Steroidobacteraceae bacterium]|nr:EAL domain-containing protein [Steroidobacteraceae bacterium]